MLIANERVYVEDRAQRRPLRMKCRACGSEAARGSHVAREQMYGLGGAFVYAECECGSLSLVEPPPLDAYYPAGYYSFGHSDLSWRVVEWMRGERAASSLLARLKRFRVALRKTDRILDVGTGGGGLPYGLARRGYRNVTGIDPFLSSERTEPGLQLLACDISAMQGAWDLVMFNHSLEHVLHPEQDLSAAVSLLRDERSALLVRLPIVAYAFAAFGTDWVALDAPRHILLPSECGVRLLAERCGAVVEAVAYESTALQFWGSELYRSGSTLHAATSRPLTAVWRHTIGALRYARRVARLNRDGAGDAAAFLLRRARTSNGAGAP